MSKRIFFLIFLCLSLHSLSAQEAKETVTREERFRVVLEPQHRTTLSAEVRSPVEKVAKRMGDFFMKGDLLIQLDETIARANLDRAKAEEEKAKTELEAKNQLFGDEIASLFEVKKAEADYAAAIAKRVEAEELFAATQIRAPYDGRVVNVLVEEHELPDVGDELIEVVDDNVLIAQILVPDRWLPYIWQQRDFAIVVNQTGEEIPAQIQRIGAVIDPTSSTIPIEAEIDNSTHHLLSGMRGQAIFRFTKALPPVYQPLAPQTEKKQRKSPIPSKEEFAPVSWESIRGNTMIYG